MKIMIWFDEKYTLSTGDIIESAEVKWMRLKDGKIDHASVLHDGMLHFVELEDITCSLHFVP